MNFFAADGWLRDAVFRRTPSGHEVVDLDVMVKDEEGHSDPDDSRVPMRLRDEALIDRLREYLTRGRIVFVRATVSTEPVHDRHGGVIGETLVFTVRELKIPNRSKAETKAEPAPPAPSAAA